MLLYDREIGETSIEIHSLFDLNRSENFLVGC
jgi:hypothetical protein